MFYKVGEPIYYAFCHASDTARRTSGSAIERGVKAYLARRGRVCSEAPTVDRAKKPTETFRTLPISPAAIWKLKLALLVVLVVLIVGDPGKPTYFGAVLVGAVLTLTRNWVSAGASRGRVKRRSESRWQRTCH